MKIGIIKRINRKYTLTAFGKAIYYTALIKIENTINNYWKLMAIDAIEMSKDVAAEERKKMIDIFIDDLEIRDVLVSNNSRFEFTRPCAAESLQQKQIHQLKQGMLAY